MYGMLYVRSCRYVIFMNKLSHAASLVVTSPKGSASSEVEVGSFSVAVESYLPDG